MRVLPIVLLIALASCGGSLSDEQRKQMHERMEENRIVRVTEVEITEGAFQEGRRVVHLLDSLKTNPAASEAFIRQYQGDIRFIAPDSQTFRLLEQQLIDAYLADTTGFFQDNVQNVRNPNGEVDSVLYTKPQTVTRPDGAEQLVGVWNIWLSKKDLVKLITRTKEE